MQRSFGNKKTFFFAYLLAVLAFLLFSILPTSVYVNLYVIFGQILESYWPFLALASLISTFYYYQLVAGGPNLAR